MKKTIILIIVILIVIAAGVYLIWQYQLTTPETAPTTETTPTIDESLPYTDVNTQKAYALTMDTKVDLVIIDVSPHYDDGHLPGSVNYYLGDGSLDRAIPSLDKNKTYLVYCHVDSVSISGAEKLADAGFKKIYRLEGNYSAWEKVGYPIEIEIKAVGNYSGNGLATRSFLNGKFVHTVEANLSDPAPGKFYEGWLVKRLSFFSTGKMEKKNGKYILKYESDEDSRDYKQVVITEETEANGLDGNPEAHVLEGEFK